MKSAEITGLTIYPVKSMQGIPIQDAALTDQGLENDRRFMVVNASGRFVTQRDLPLLASIQTRLEADGVVLSRAGHGSVVIPFAATGGERIQTKVWGDECETIDLGEKISRWLSSALDSSSTLRLVRMAPNFVRPQNQPDRLGQDTNTVFADASPLLVANEASLEALNHELEARSLSTVPMNRFRPNIVLQGLAPFAEHQVTELKSKNYDLKLCGPCERCVVTTIDQATGIKNPEHQPFKTLRDINSIPGNVWAPSFAENAVIQRGTGQRISVGDILDIHSKDILDSTE